MHESKICQIQSWTYAEIFHYAAAMWTINPDVLVTDLGDELILMHPASSEMFSLNATGKILWQNLPADLETLSAVMESTYGITSTQAQTDAKAMLKNLAARDLLRES